MQDNHENKINQVKYNYNTSNETLRLREYGRNIQKLGVHITKIDDKKERTEAAILMVQMMAKLNPNRKENQEFEQKLWGDIIIASGYKLDIDSPYDNPAPKKEVKKPAPLTYNRNKFRYKHYGNNINKLVKAVAMFEESGKKDVLVKYIAQLMKTLYKVWNKNNVEDSVILNNIKEISEGKINVENLLAPNSTLRTLYETNDGYQKNSYSESNKSNGYIKVRKRSYVSRKDGKNQGNRIRK